MCDDDLAALYLERSLSAQSSMTEEEIKQAARESMDTHLAQAIINDANAPETALTGSEDAIAWIMFNSVITSYSIHYTKLYEVNRRRQTSQPGSRTRPDQPAQP